MHFPKPPYSIAQYAISFSLVLGLVLLAISSWTLHALNQVDQQITATNQQAARSDLTEAIAEVQHKAERSARDIAIWDETRQQLANPTYYLYWRAERIRESGLIPSAIEAVELYDVNKKAISKPAPTSLMPPVILGQTIPGTLISNDAGKILLYYFFPIYADESQQLLLGYGGLKMNFLAELERLHGFRTTPWSEEMAALTFFSSCETPPWKELARRGQRPLGRVHRGHRVLDRDAPQVAVRIRKPRSDLRRPVGEPGMAGGRVHACAEGDTVC